MQRIRTTRWPTRNIGGDRAYCKLKYVNGVNMGIAIGNSYTVLNQIMNCGSLWNPSPSPDGTYSPCTYSAVMGNTPNLSTMGALYQRYRIRGVKVRLTYWKTSGPPCFIFLNAATDQSGYGAQNTAPNPDFPEPTIAVLPEQRWAKYRVCQNTIQGGRATTLSAYYSVNRVFGPDSMTKNDHDFTGEMSPNEPYWGAGPVNPSEPLGLRYVSPIRGPWFQWGVSTLDGQTVSEEAAGVVKIEQTVYCEFFGKRVTTQ